MASIDVPSTLAFDAAAPRYDAMRRRLIPCFDDFYGTALTLIEDWWPAAPVGQASPAAEARPVRVLDLGAGTGLLSSLVLGRHPEAQIRLLDASPAMLEQARLRFGDRPNLDYAVADLATAPLDGPWDLVISALAIHHLDDAGKRSLFERIRAALAAGGLFVNAEQVLGPTPALESRYAGLWLEAIRGAGVPEPDIAAALARMSFDRCATVEHQLAWLRDAGFDDVDCSFKAWRFAVLNGRG